jgi:competence ComEA-like helix-hairpin-helix protein
VPAGVLRVGLEAETGRILCVGFVTISCACVVFALVCAMTETDAAWPVPGPAVDARINPNHASAASLSRLPGIGPTRARMIVAYRQAFAGRTGQAIAFRCPEDLTAIAGIGPVTVEKVRAWLRFEPSEKALPQGTDRP